MKTLFTAEALSKGRRSGCIQAPDWLMNLPLGNPLEPDGEQHGPNPGLLFACPYSEALRGDTAVTPVVDWAAQDAPSGTEHRPGFRVGLHPIGRLASLSWRSQATGCGNTFAVLMTVNGNNRQPELKENP